MNYLSHFLLSAQASPDIQLGNFLGDIVSKSEADSLPPTILQGIEFHRFIDHFTDNHPLVLDGKRLLYPKFGKYASVILDVYLDFALIEHWDDYSDQPIGQYLNSCYQFVDSRLAVIPSRVKPRVQKMTSAKWMHGYLTDAGRVNLFGRLATRAKYDKNFAQAVDIYAEYRLDLHEIHRAFYPILDGACQDWLREKVS